MRTVIISRVHNSYRVGTNSSYNGFTYTEGAAKNAPNNCLADNGDFKFHGAPSIPDTWFPNNYRGAEDIALEVAEQANLAYGQPIAVVNHKGQEIKVFDWMQYDTVTKDYYTKDDLVVLLQERTDKLVASALKRAEDNKNGVFESEIR